MKKDTKKDIQEQVERSHMRPFERKHPNLRSLARQWVCGQWPSLDTTAIVGGISGIVIMFDSLT